MLFQITTTTTTLKNGEGGQKIFLLAVPVKPARPCFRPRLRLQWKMNGRWTRPTLYAFDITRTVIIRSRCRMWLTDMAVYPTRTSTMSTLLKFYPSSINSWRTNAAQTALLTNLWRPRRPLVTTKRTRNSIQPGHVPICLWGVTLSNTFSCCRFVLKSCLYQRNRTGSSVRNNSHLLYIMVCQSPPDFFRWILSVVE